MNRPRSTSSKVLLSIALMLSFASCWCLSSNAKEPQKPSTERKSSTKAEAEPKAEEPAPEAIIWTNHKANCIFAADLKGDRTKTVYGDNPGADCLALDLKTRKLYTSVWTDGPDDGHKIRELDIASGETRDVITGRYHVVDIALDHEKGKLYWTCIDTGDLQRGNVDGTQVENFVTGLNRPDELAIDEAAGKIYWTEHAGRCVGCIDRDGKNRKQILKNLPSPVMGIALDTEHGRIYVCLRTPGDIISTKLDGTDRKTILSDLVEADGIALDVPRDKIYWMDQAGIHSARLDGTDIKEVMLGATSPYGTILLAPDLPNLLEPKFETPAK